MAVTLGIIRLITIHYKQLELIVVLKTQKMPYVQ